MEVRRTAVDKPFFSICIPQYNRTSFLIMACRVLAEQTYKNFEVCVSDDCSTDGRERELIEFLEESGLSFVYRKLERNSKYDSNLRASIALARSQFCFLFGNDDCLASSTTLEEVYNKLQRFEPVSVAITNYKDFVTGKETRRIMKTGIIGTGPEVAANNYRNFSFVSGVLLDAAKAKEHATGKWDGSEMYQMFIGCRIIAEGGRLLGIDKATVRKDIQIGGEYVDSYALKPRIRPCPIIERRHTFHLIGRLVEDAIQPYSQPSQRRKLSGRILLQLLLFTYPFWIVEYRQVQSWKYAVGICLGMRPRNAFFGLRLNLLQRVWLSGLYGLVSVIGLSIPTRMFTALYPASYRFAKSVFAAAGSQ